MLAHEGIDENLRFLILEVQKQLEHTRDYMDTRAEPLVEKILARDDYIDNLKTVVQRKCFVLAGEAAGEAIPSVDMLRALDVISANLERISDFCENIIKQLGFLGSYKILERHDFSPYFDEVINTVDEIEEAIFEQDLQLALTICRAEHTLDQMYGDSFREILAELEGSSNPHELLTVLFISHYFERMGDSLLNIGEAVISSCLGERIKIDQFQALEETLGARGLEGDVILEAMGETRSGCRIDRVTERDEDRSNSVIFKEGRNRKTGRGKGGRRALARDHARARTAHLLFSGPRNQRRDTFRVPRWTHVRRDSPAWRRRNVGRRCELPLRHVARDLDDDSFGRAGCRRFLLSTARAPRRRLCSSRRVPPSTRWNRGNSSRVVRGSRRES